MNFKTFFLLVMIVGTFITPFALVTYKVSFKDSMGISFDMVIITVMAIWNFYIPDKFRTSKKFLDSLESNE